MPLEPQPPAAPAPLGAQQIRTKIHQIARRQWWLWSSVMMVTLLLPLGVASFAFPGLLSEPEAFYSFHLNLAIRGLVGLVLLFNGYTVYQQLLIYLVSRKLSGPGGAFGKMG